MLWMAIERFVGLHDVHIDKHPDYTNWIAVPAILVYVLFLREKREKDLKGSMSYKQALISGLFMTLVVTILVPLNQWLTTYWITPDYFKNVIDYSVKNELMTLEDAEEYFNFNSYLIQSLVFAPIMGILTTSIVAIFLKKEVKN